MCLRLSLSPRSVVSPVMRQREIVVSVVVGGDITRKEERVQKYRMEERW